jgi:hypothetical protein
VKWLLLRKNPSSLPKHPIEDVLYETPLSILMVELGKKSPFFRKDLRVSGVY